MSSSQTLVVAWLLLPMIVGILFLYFRGRSSFLKPFLVSTFIGYVFVVISAQVRDVELKARLYELDTNGDGVFSSGEMTPEVNRRLMAVSNDTGRTFAPITGFPISAIWSAINLGFLTFCIYAVKTIRRRVQDNGSTFDQSTDNERLS